MFTRIFFAQLFLIPLLTMTMTVSAEDAVFYSTSDFAVGRFDLDMYLRNAPSQLGDAKLGSRVQTLQALSDLYAAEILIRDVESAPQNFLTVDEVGWIAAYAVRMERIRRYLDWRVKTQVEQTDWAQEALEQYLGAKDEYVVPEAVSLRTLLIRTENRTEQEAIDLALSLTSKSMTAEQFEAVIREHSEDEVAAAVGGLMTDITRGQTVAPFEQAAFQLREPGEMSDPVVSQFGAHVIQLVRYRPAKQLLFEQAREKIISELKIRRPKEYLAAIQSEARERKPEGFKEHTESLDALMLLTSDGPLGAR